MSVDLAVYNIVQKKYTFYPNAHQLVNAFTKCRISIWYNTTCQLKATNSDTSVTWMNLKNIKPSLRRQIRAKDCLHHLGVMSRMTVYFIYSKCLQKENGYRQKAAHGCLQRGVEAGMSCTRAQGNYLGWWTCSKTGLWWWSPNSISWIK